jgi:hypothetical protein
MPHILHVVFWAIFNPIKKTFEGLFSIRLGTRSILKKKMHNPLSSETKAKIFGII